MHTCATCICDPLCENESDVAKCKYFQTDVWKYLNSIICMCFNFLTFPPCTFSKHKELFTVQKTMNKQFPFQRFESINPQNGGRVRFTMALCLVFPMSLLYFLWGSIICLTKLNHLATEPPSRLISMSIEPDKSLEKLLCPFYPCTKIFAIKITVAV